jgi:hypothetical protein
MAVGGEDPTRRLFRHVEVKHNTVNQTGMHLYVKRAYTLSFLDVER